MEFKQMACKILSDISEWNASRKEIDVFRKEKKSDESEADQVQANDKMKNYR